MHRDHAVALMGVVSIVLASTSGCYGVFCRAEVIKEVNSPDGRYIATHYESACMVDSIDDVVKVRESHIAFNPSRRSDNVYVESWMDQLEMEWLGTGELRIHVKSVDAVLKKDNSHDLRITYDDQISTPHDSTTMKDRVEQ